LYFLDDRYAGFVSILNFAGIVSEYSGAFLTHLLGVHRENFTNLPYLILICTVSSFLPLLFLRFLPEGNVKSLVEENMLEVEEPALELQEFLEEEVFSDDLSESSALTCPRTPDYRIKEDSFSETSRPIRKRELGDDV